MKQHRLAATAATAAAAAIVALGSTGVAHAEANPASSTTRITSAVQLQANLQQAITLEQAQVGALGTGPAGKAID
ncbi:MULTISPECIES: hypothetical protein [unclassified Streptomyces]|uniref:hypothetical protein n=1 Tax=unclassified Streptomyces TaxID=2593676 RepID=UPI002E2A79D9|nr:hypothetical protein [Streptomyces sp. NBC_00223]